MLAAPTPFPHSGSFGFLRSDGRTLVRVIRPDGGDLLVSGGAVGASGARRVAVADLINATPLDAAEEAEYDRLDRELAGKARPHKAKAERHRVLRDRADAAARADRLRARAADGRA